MGKSSFFGEPVAYDVVDEGGEGSGFYEGPAYTQIDPVAIANSVAAAAASASAAASAQAAAAASATSADASEAAALASENAADASEAAAASSATAAAGSASTASTQATNAATSATNAATSATNAANSATAAAGSASSASTSATTATTQAGNASSSASAAATSATNAATSETNAASSASSAAAAAAGAVSAKADKTTTISAGGIATGGGDLSANRTITVTKSSNAQAVAGVDDSTAMTPVRVKDAILAIAGAGLYVAPQGRLTLQTGVAVMLTTQSAKTTIYYTPYVGNMVPLYDGTNMIMTAISEISVATTDTAKNPAAIGASKVNDWFVWDDGGTLRLSHGPDWTNDTTRSAGTALVMVNGILLNNASITNGPAASRGTYVGTTRSNSSSQLAFIVGGSGTAGWVGVWNAYNRRPIWMNVAEGTSSWTYTTAAIRASNNSTTSRVSFVTGLAEDPVGSSFNCRVDLVAASTSYTFQGIALDTTTSINSRDILGGTVTGSGWFTSHNNVYRSPPLLGFHYIASVEQGDGSNVNTVYGSSGYFNLAVDVWG